MQRGDQEGVEAGEEAPKVPVRSDVPRFQGRRRRSKFGQIGAGAETGSPAGENNNQNRWIVAYQGKRLVDFAPHCDGEGVAPFRPIELYRKYGSVAVQKERSFQWSVGDDGRSDGGETSIERPEAAQNTERRRMERRKC